MEGLFFICNYFHEVLNSYLQIIQRKIIGVLGNGNLGKDRKRGIKDEYF